MKRSDFGDLRACAPLADHFVEIAPYGATVKCPSVRHRKVGPIYVGFGSFGNYSGVQSARSWRASR